MTTTNTATAAAPATKPVVRPGANGSFSVRFPCGGTAEIYQVSGPSGQEWSFRGVKSDGTDVRNMGRYSCVIERTLEAAWLAVSSAPAAVSMSLADVHAAARAANDDAATTSKVLKKILFARTGIKFTVRCGTGTARSYVHISGKSIADRVVLASIFGELQVNGDGCTVSPDNNNRIWFVCRAAGVSMPA